MAGEAQKPSEYLEEVRASARSMTRERFESRYPWCFLGVLSAGGGDLTIQYTTRSSQLDPDRVLESNRLIDLLPMVKTSSAYSGPTSLVVGRSRACDLWLNDASISKTHARFTLEKQKPVTLTDLGSRNHTRVCGEKLTAQVAMGVRVGDLIVFGSVPARLLDARTLHDMLK